MHIRIVTGNVAFHEIVWWKGRALHSRRQIMEHPRITLDERAA